MAYELTIKKTATFQNPELEKLTAEMATACMTARNEENRSKLICAKILGQIEADKLYETDGFESALDFAIRVMVMPQSTAYMYIQVGRALHTNSVPTCDANGNPFTLTQLRSICGIKETAKRTEAVNNAEITADMTKDEINETVKTINPAKKERKIAEKRYLWLNVGDDNESADMSKTELISGIAENGGQYLGELISDGSHYVVAIDASGYPVLYRQGEQVKAVVDAK